MWLLGRVPVRRKYQILGLCLVSVALFLAVALFTRDPRDTASDLLSTGAVRNQGGVVGAFVSTGIVGALGAVGAWLVPIALIAWGWNRLRLRPAGELWLRTAVAATGAAAALGLLYLLSGGIVGWSAARGGIGLTATRCSVAWGASSSWARRWS